MGKTSRKLAYLGLCTAVALILAYVEVFLPTLFTAVHGIKLRHPNIGILFVLYRYGMRYAAAVSFVRMAVVALLFGNPMLFVYSMAGAALRLLVMALLRRLDFLSVDGVSVAGGVFHNVGQILMAMLLLGTAELGYYLIVLAITGTVSGIFVGLCGGLAVRRIPGGNM